MSPGQSIRPLPFRMFLFRCNGPHPFFLWVGPDWKGTDDPHEIGQIRWGDASHRAGTPFGRRWPAAVGRRALDEPPMQRRWATTPHGLFPVLLFQPP